MSGTSDSDSDNITDPPIEKAFSDAIQKSFSSLKIRYNKAKLENYNKASGNVLLEREVKSIFVRSAYKDLSVTVWDSTGDILLLGSPANLSFLFTSCLWPWKKKEEVMLESNPTNRTYYFSNRERKVQSHAA